VRASDAALGSDASARKCTAFWPSSGSGLAHARQGPVSDLGKGRGVVARVSHIVGNLDPRGKSSVRRLRRGRRRLPPLRGNPHRRAVQRPVRPLAISTHAHQVVHDHLQCRGHDPPRRRRCVHLTCRPTWTRGTRFIAATTGRRLRTSSTGLMINPSTPGNSRAFSCSASTSRESPASHRNGLSPEP
jgi:hypothetical protein